MINFYAGIGSRNTPENILNIMKFIAIKLDSDGFCLRSGHAIGADTAFESNIKNKEIFEANDASLKAIEYASNFHNNWNNCSNYVKKLHGRNSMIILGKNLDQPVKFVICWTQNGKDIGGTGLSIRIAKHNNIPVFNLYNENVLTRFQNYINSDIINMMI